MSMARWFRSIGIKILNAGWGWRIPIFTLSPQVDDGVTSWSDNGKASSSSSMPSVMLTMLTRWMCETGCAYWRSALAPATTPRC